MGFHFKNILLRFALNILLWPFSNVYVLGSLEKLIYYVVKMKLIREFWLNRSPPHFTDIRQSFFLSNKNKFPPWLNRGFYTRQVISNGYVLDLGCGNGFFG